MSGSILEYKGREAHWAALCSFDGYELSVEMPDPDDADGEIDAIWEFVVENCQEYGISIPSKQEAIAELRAMIISHIADKE